MISTNILVCQSADGTKKGEISWQNFSGVRGGIRTGRSARRKAARTDRGRRGQAPESGRTEGAAREGEGGAKPGERDAARGKRPSEDAKGPRGNPTPGGLAALRPKERADPTTRRAAHAARCRAAYANGRAAEGARSAHLISNDTPLLLPPQGKMRGRGAYKSRAAAAAAARKSLWITGTTPRPDP